MYDLIIVDDEQDLLDYLKLVIEREQDWSVQYFCSPEEALAQFQSCGARAVLTDIEMPQMNGDELLGRLRTLAPEVAVFAMTGGQTGHLVDKGFEHVFKKPFCLDDMIGELGKAIDLEPNGCRADRGVLSGQNG